MKLLPKYLSLSLLFVLPLAGTAQDKKSDLHTLIVFFDGLRPDYITPEQMPNLYAFSKRGSYGKQHHSVFPTVTRVNASSYATGSYPATHGLMGNTVYFPEVNATTGLNTGEAAELDKIAKATGDKLLTAPSLGEILNQNGYRMMVFSSGSTGQALMQNHKVSGGAVINPNMVLPESWKAKVASEIGAVPPGLGKHEWVTNALIRYGLAPDGPLVSAIWYGDPDGAAHANGIGSALAVESIKYVDAQFGRIIQELNERGLSDKFNILVSTDHGFVTHTGKRSLNEFLVSQGLKQSTTSEDVVVAEGAIYVKNHDPAQIRKIVAALQEQDWVGGIFTKGNPKSNLKGEIPGTLSLASVHWDHARSSDILVDVNWNDEKNDAGYAGKSTSRGVAGHGSSSPYEVHIALLAGGPSFKKAFEGNLPSSNVDIVPTVLHLHHLAAPSTMDGRVLYELLNEKTPASAPQTAKRETVRTEQAFPWGTYTLVMDRTLLGNYWYVNFTKAERVKK